MSVETDPYRLKKCDNPLCDRQVTKGTLYCCSPCAVAHRDGYEIHEDGPLGHTKGCDERIALRAERDKP